MTLFAYDATRLPDITLIGKDGNRLPHRNISRVSKDYIYYFVTDGELFFCEDGKEYRLSKGDCFLFEPNTWHYGTADSVYQVYYLHFRHDGIAGMTEEAIWEDFISLPKHINIPDHFAFNNMIALLRKAIEYNKVPCEKGDNILSACAVQELLVTLSRVAQTSGKKKPNIGAMQRIDEVIAYLNCHYREKLSGERIEKEVSYSFDYLNQLFRRCLDTTVFGMLEDIRMYHARKLVLTSEFSIKNIALEVGYTDESYFSKVFKKHYGLSPLQYKKHEIDSTL